MEEQQSTTEAQSENNTAEITGHPVQVAKMAAMAFNAGKDVEIEHADGQLSAWHETFENTRKKGEEAEVSVSDYSDDVARVDVGVFYVTFHEGVSARVRGE